METSLSISPASSALVSEISFPTAPLSFNLGVLAADAVTV